MLDSAQQQLCNNEWRKTAVVVITLLFFFFSSMICVILTVYLIPRRTAVNVYTYQLQDLNKQDDSRLSLREWTLFAGFFSTLGIAAMDLYLAFDKRPAQPSDMSDARVEIVNFVIHLAWLTTFALIWTSVLLNHGCAFKDVIHTREWTILNWLHGLVIFWWLSSVLLTVFQQGVNVDYYWNRPPNKVYIVRVWYTNCYHIILMSVIVYLPVIWIKRSQRKWYHKFIYLFLFLLTSATIAISGYRLYTLHKRFGASDEVRYELAIQAVMYSVIEALVAIICVNLPAIGWQPFFCWLNRHRFGPINGTDFRNERIGFGPIPLRDIGHHERGEDQEGGERDPYYRPYQPRFDHY